VHHRDEARSLLESVTEYDGAIVENTAAANMIAAASAHATLAQADAIEALTAVLAGLSFPALEVKKCLTNTGYQIRPVKR
jgi:predicted nucleic acid-binding protein